MRHRSVKKTLGRTADPRRALLRSMATSLIIHDAITTTEGKAAALRPYVEKLITKGKTKTMISERYLLKHLYTKKAVEKMLNVVGPKYATRPGGYTRTVKIGFRPGDGAKLVTIELV